MQSSHLLERPPLELVMPATWQNGVLTGAIIILALCMLEALKRLAFNKDPLMLFCLIGGAAASMLEPVADVLGKCFHPEIGQIVGFEAMGRKIPLHVALIYPWYFGMFAWVIVDGMDKGTMTAAKYWRIFFGTKFFTMLVEIPPLLVGVWGYYGAQPFAWRGIPFWWYVVNSAAIFCAGALAWLGVRNLNGWQRWPVMILIPVGAIGFHTGFSAPLAIALHTDNSVWENVIPGIVTMAFAMYGVKFFVQLLFPETCGERGSHARSQPLSSTA